MSRFGRVAACAAVLVAAVAVLEVGADQATPHSVYAFDAPFHGSTGLVGLNDPIVGMAPVPDGTGYWTVTKGGEVSPFGAAPWLGRTPLFGDDRIAGMAATPSGLGYWLVTTDGDVFSAGDAGILGSGLGEVDEGTVVGIAAKPDGKGFWLVTARGEVLPYGTAVGFGGLDAVALNGPVVGIASSASGKGYWLVARDGGVFAFGDAAFHGSMGATRLRRAVVGMTRTSGGDGYLVASSEGGVYAFGDGSFRGSLADAQLPEPVVGIAAAPGGGYWLALTGHLAPGVSPRAEADHLWGDDSNTIGDDGVAAARPGTYRQIHAQPGCAFTIRGGDGAIRSTGSGSGRHVVRLRDSDTAFQSLDCGDWTTDLFPATPTLGSSVGNGTWLLGIDIRSGTWRSPGGASCTWSTLADLSRLPSGILQSGGGVGPQAVQLAGSEVAFATAGCGTWTPD
ncbi:MAG: hypothetical protein AB7H43_13200 [Acidimicrobiia bacterium]